MSNKVVIMRGLPGSGKSYYIDKTYQIKTEERHYYYFSTDLFWYINDTATYQFDTKRIQEAHNWNYGCYLERLHSLIGYNKTIDKPIIVDNTSISAWEIAPYLLAASAYGFEHEIITVWADLIVCIKRNVHNVPATVIMNMYQRLLTETLPPFWKHTIVYPEQRDE